MRLILASASPRRRELLAQLRDDFEVCPSNVAEQRQHGETASVYVQRLAKEKAEAVANNLNANSDTPIAVLGSDTLIELADQVLEKPQDKADFLAMMRLLSDRKHWVRTAVAVCVWHQGQILTTRVVEQATEISFGAVSKTQALRYWDTGEPVDKAAGYAIQGGAARFIKAINGSYSAVVGLPLYQTEQLLNQIESEFGGHYEC